MKQKRKTNNFDDYSNITVQIDSILLLLNIFLFI